jgi:hypothetical protein
MRDNMTTAELQLLSQVLNTDFTELSIMLKAQIDKIASLPDGEEKAYVQKHHKACQAALEELLSHKIKFMSKWAIEADPISFTLTNEEMDIIDEKMNSMYN